MKNKRLIIIVSCILLVLIIVLISALKIKNNMEKSSKAIVIEVDEKQNDKVKETVNDEIKETLSNMSEQKRIEYYVSEFIKAIEARDISYSYKMLNTDFKNNYFKTEDSFSEYIKKYFPKETSVKYTNMERLGDLYVLDLEIKDILSNDPNNFSCYVVVKENDYNNFELSFSVNSAMEKYTENN